MIKLHCCPVRAALLARVFPHPDFALARDLVAFLYFHFIYADLAVQRRALQDFRPVLARFPIQDWFDRKVSNTAYDNPEHLVCPPWLEVQGCIETVAGAMIINGIDITPVEIGDDWMRHWQEPVRYEELEANTKSRFQVIAERLVLHGDVERCALRTTDFVQRPRQLGITTYNLDETLKLLPLRAILAYDLHCALLWNTADRQRDILKTHFHQELDAVVEIVCSDMPTAAVVDRLSAVKSKYSHLTPQQAGAMQELDSHGSKARAMLHKLFDAVCALVTYLTTMELDKADDLVYEAACIYHDDAAKVLARLLRDRLGTFPNLGKAVDRELCDW